MKNYKMMIDISYIFGYIKHLKLQIYNNPFPTIFVSAKNPDDACKIIFDELIDIILAQDSSIQMRIICRKVKKLCRIDKIYGP